MRKEPVIIIGGDKRQKYVYTVLSEDGYNCKLENRTIENIPELLSESRYVILPMPSSKDGRNIFCSNKDFVLSFKELSDMLTDRHIVLGGNLSSELTCLLDRKNIVYHDFSNNESFLLYNAFLTAQGALRLLLDSTEKYINNSEVLITGFGRIGKALAIMLSNLKLSVTVCARKDSQLVLAESLGLDTIRYDMLKEAVTETDYIFNTVPERVFESEHIINMNKEAIYFELASAPYGVDKNLFDTNGLTYVNGSALPGRYTPNSAGERIAKTIEKLI